MKRLNLLNKKFGKLTVIKFVGIKRDHTYWQCKCDCGNSLNCTSDSLITGNTKSCGCIRKEHNNNTKHNMCHTRFYNILRGMKQRCNNINHPRHKDYGDRGIKCEWKSFIKFKDDMYVSYLKHCQQYGEKNTTIDRINNNGNYNKENCKWSTYKEQNFNKRNNLH